jgi:hypothetical protein
LLAATSLVVQCFKAVRLHEINQSFTVMGLSELIDERGYDVVVRVDASFNLVWIIGITDTFILRLPRRMDHLYLSWCHLSLA